MSVIQSRLLAGMVLTTALLCGPARAYTLEQYTFDDPQRFEDFRGLIGEMRCLVCQNESLAASQADVAEDLRHEIYKMMKAGKSRQEVIDYMVSRYGDFVLYAPPVRPSTWILWFGPFVLVAISGFFLMRTLAQRKREPEQELSEEEKTRLQQLLASDGESKQD